MAEIIAFPQQPPQEKRQKRKRPFSEQMYIFSKWISRHPPTLGRNFLLAVAAGNLEEAARIGDLLKRRRDLNIKVIGGSDRAEELPER